MKKLSAGTGIAAAAQVRNLPAGKVLLHLSVIYLVGLLGLSFPFSEPYFRLLVPFNILLSVLVVLVFHEGHSPKFWLFVLLASHTGFLVELAGITTGYIFGEYYYEGTLGVKLAGVPLLIGLNWFMLVYCAGTVMNGFAIHWIWKALMAAALMVVYDLLLEPSAIRFDFWQWKDDTIPLQNYFAWFGIAFFLLAVFYRMDIQKFNNQVAKGLFWIQLLFFGFLWATYKISP